MPLLTDVSSRDKALLCRPGEGSFRAATRGLPLASICRTPCVVGSRWQLPRGLPQAIEHLAWAALKGELPLPLVGCHPEKKYGEWQQ